MSDKRGAMTIAWILGAAIMGAVVGGIGYAIYEGIRGGLN